MRDFYLSEEDQEQQKRVRDAEIRQQQIAQRTPMGPTGKENAMADALIDSQSAVSGTQKWNDNDVYNSTGGLGFLLAPIMNKITGSKGKLQPRIDSEKSVLKQSRQMQLAKGDRERNNQGLKSWQANQDKLIQGQQGINADIDAAELVSGAKIDAAETEQGYKVDLKLQELGNNLAEESVKNQYDIESEQQELKDAKNQFLFEQDETAYGESYAESKKTANSAIESIEGWKRFQNASNNAWDGGLADMAASVTNFAASFGIDSEMLTNVALMRQTIAAEKAGFMERLGARGLTDKDMEIIAQYLPDVSTSKEARGKIAEIMMRANKKDMDNHIDLIFSDEKRRADSGREIYRRPSWVRDEMVGYDRRKQLREDKRRREAAGYN
jgi:hypothetical protein